MEKRGSGEREREREREREAKKGFHILMKEIGNELQNEGVAIKVMERGRGGEGVEILLHSAVFLRQAFIPICKFIYFSS